jgi:hypothetical protein
MGEIMKNFKLYMMIFFLFLSLTAVNLFAQDSLKTKKTPEKEKQTTQHFIDKDGDGYNDNAPDHDGDGIPNGLDPDWQKQQSENGKNKRLRYVDLDGDGINDNLQPGFETEGEKGDHLNSKKNGSSLNDKSKQESAPQKKKQRGKE